MTIRALVRAALLSVLLAASACATRPLDGRGVIIYDRTRIEAAEKARNLLEAEGLTIEMQVRGPLPRSRSTIAVYGSTRDPERTERIREALKPLGDMEWVADPQPGPGDTVVVVWLEPL